MAGRPLLQNGINEERQVGAPGTPTDPHAEELEERRGPRAGEGPDSMPSTTQAGTIQPAEISEPSLQNVYLSTEAY